MKTCSYCGAQIADDSSFCTECGKECKQGNACPHCGELVNDDDSFCQNCGKSLGGTNIATSITNNDGNKKGIKKYLPYFIGAFVFLIIIGYFSSNNTNDSKQENDAIETDTIAADSSMVSEVYSKQEIQEMNRFLEKFYKGLKYDDDKATNAYIKKNVTANGQQTLKKIFSMVYQGEGLADWVFEYSEFDYDLTTGSLVARKIIPQEKNNFLIENYYENEKYPVLLTVVKENSVYKIDKIEQLTSTDTTDKQRDVNNLDWLQGLWVYEQGNYKGYFLIQGNTISQYSSTNPKHYDATYRIEGNELRARLVDGMDLVVKIDFANHTIDYGDGNWMHKIK